MGLFEVGKTIRNVIELLEGSSLDELERILDDSLMQKQAQEFIEYQRPERTVRRSPHNDRVFPLETITVNNYQSSLEKVNIHTGAYANELALRMNALALVMGEDIYFRNGAYQPESEEGRKILAHEMTHIAQYKEKRVTKNADRKALEREAELAESQAEYDPDPYEPYPVGNKVYYLRRSQIESLTKLVADKVEEWILEQKIARTEEEYLNLLCAYSEWLDEEAVW
jgi:hypothetical protein